MLMKVVVENGVKKLVPLTADAGSGNPCGTVITTLSNTVPSGYLPLGAQFDMTQFPVLYAILGSDTIPTASALGLPTLSAGRYVIKATSGINENQADNVLSALTHVDQVALNNLHSVTSNAVANESAKQTHIFPICTTHLVTNNTSWTPYTYIGGFFLAKYNNYPQVSGKTKKLHLVLTAFTQSSNSITIGIKRSTDPDYTTILYNATVWGGVESGAYGDIYTLEVDPDYLTSHTIIAFKTNDGNSSVAIGSVFAEVYYE
jgi:hypothetical protein